MVKVPVYTREVADRPALRQGVDVQASPDAFGASVGRGMQQAAQGLGNLGEALDGIRALEDETAVRDARNQYMRERDELMYNPETGYMNSQGKNALDQRKAFDDSMRTLRDKYVGGLDSRRQGMFTRAIEPLEADTKRSAMIHNGTQLKSYVIDQGNAAVANFQNEALRNAGNSTMADKYMAAAVGEMRGLAVKQGMPAEQIDLRERAFISDTTKKTALQIAASDPLAADAYLKKNAGRMAAEDKLAVEESLKAPILAAKAERNVAGFVGGAPAPDYSRTPLPPTAPVTGPNSGGRTSTPISRPATGVQSVVRGMIGMSEAANSGAISSFISRSAGMNVDPRVTPWCAAFANAVLGANGIEGTGQLNARSFLNFGSATDRPQPGDVVVLSRGNDQSKGHVGFFQGFDQNGNVMVAGGNQGKDGRVSVATFNAETVLGFRTAGTVSGQATRLPTYNPEGLAFLYQEAAKIKDPAERAATLKAAGNYYEMQKKAIDAARQDAEAQVASMIFANPAADLLRLPPEMQDALGASGMTTAMNLQEKVRSHGQPTTDDRALAELSDAYATDPQAYASKNLFDYRDKLSNADWKTVSEWQRTAKTDQRKAREEGTGLKAAFDQAKIQLEAVGVTTVGTKESEREAASKRVVQFQNALASEIEAFKRASDGKGPTFMETQSMINRLLLPIVIKTPGMLWHSRQDALAFEAGGRADGTTVDVVVKYGDIPIDLRRGIATDLERELGRKPSEDEVTSRYETFVLNR